MSKKRADYNWDFFIAHAGTDNVPAEQIYDLLCPHARVFLDSRCLMLGDDWDYKLAEAQRSALITLVLISKDTDQAYYEREEIAAAIALARANGQSHRVVPIYLDSQPVVSTAVPYGLRLKKGLTVSDDLGWSDVATRLLELLDGLEPTTGDAKPTIAKRARSSVTERSSTVRTSEPPQHVTKKCKPLSVTLAIVPMDEHTKLFFNFTKGCNPDDTPFYTVVLIISKKSGDHFVEAVNLNITIGTTLSEQAQLMMDTGLNEAQIEMLHGPIKTRARELPAGTTDDPHMTRLVESMLQK